MTLSSPGTSDRREAAVAAALAGAVVVVLGYASGLGSRSTSDAVAMQQPPAAEQAVQPPVSAVPALPAAAPGGSAHHPVLDPGHADHVGHSTHQPNAHDHQPPSPAIPEPVQPEPAPEPEAPDCEPAVLDGLPVLDGLLGPVTGSPTSLVTSLVGGTPALGDLGLPAAEAALGCVIGEVVGPACCGTPAATGTRTRTEASR